VLLNRISHVELSQVLELRKGGARIPEIRNDLATDDLYPAEAGYEPDRADEVLQTWEAIKCLCTDLSGRDVNDSLRRSKAAIARARTAYDAIKAAIRLDPKSGDEHLDAISEGLRQFALTAEIADTPFDQG
jgi:hypothetical protein